MEPKAKKLRKSVLGENFNEEKLRDAAIAVFGNNADLDFTAKNINDSKTDSGLSSLESGNDEKESGSDEEEFVVDFSLQPQPERKPAWVDESDSKIKVKDVVSTYAKFRGKRGERETSNKVYEEQLRQKFSNVYGAEPEWAKLDRKIDDESDEEDDITKQTGTYLMGQKSSIALPKTRLEFKKLNDLNRDSYSEGNLIKCTEFNPNSDSTPIALVAGTSGKTHGSASLFQVDGVNNHKIHSMKFEKFPIKCGHFTRDGKMFIVGSNFYGHFFVHDIIASKTLKIPWNKAQDRNSMKNFAVSPDGHIIFAGNSGQLHVFDGKAISHVETLQSPSDVNSITFNPDGSRMYTHGDGGEVFIWDMTTRSCIHKFYDDGCIDGTSISLAPNSRYLACGSSSGVVNIYETSKILTEINPIPTKCITNLTTSVSSLLFNNSSEILAMASSNNNNAVKLAHFPSMTLFNNFPNLNKNMRKCQTMDFSPNSGYLTIGNNGGCSYLFRLKHYKTY